MIFDKGVNYIKEFARPLERQLLEFYFFDGSKYLVLEELLKFHNSDGGFGRGLEPDYRANESSILASTYAMDILIDLEFDSSEATVISTMNYIISNYNQTKSTWRLLPEIEENYAHAPWWNQNKLEKTFNFFQENPKVKICGYLFHYPTLSSEKFRYKILNEVLDYLDKRDTEASVDEILNYTRLFNSKNLPLEVKHTVKKKLNQMIITSVESNPEKWGEYCLKPINVVTSIESPFINLIIEQLNTNLDFEIENQNSDGSWSPNWNWANTFPKEWSAAKREWSGIITLERLKLLRDFNKI